MIKTKFWIFCALVLVVVGANFFYTAQRVGTEVRDDAAARLSWSEARVASVESREAKAVLDVALAAAAAPEVVEAIAGAAEFESPPDSAAFEALVSRLGEVLAEAGLPPQDRAILATAHGAGLFEVGEQLDVQSPPPDIPALSSALEGTPQAGLFQEDGLLLRVAAAPVQVDEAVQGALLLAHVVDDDYVGRVAEAVGVDVTLLVEGLVIASTAPDDLRARLSAAARRAATGDLFEIEGSAGPLTSFSSDITGVEPVSSYGKTLSMGGLDDAVLVLSVRTKDGFAWLEQYQTYHAAAFGLVVLVGLVWGFFVAVSVNGPVKVMAGQISRAASGDMKTRLEVSRFRGELRRLAELVNGVLDQAERKGPIGPPAAAEKKEDISSLLTDSPAETEESAPDPDAFDFGFDKGGEDAAPPAPQEEPKAEEQSLDPEPQPGTAAEAEEQASPIETPADVPETHAPSGPKVEADEEDPFAAFDSPQPEAAQSGAPAEQAQEAEEEDPFAAFDSPAPASPTGDLDAAAAATAEDYQEDDSTRVVSLDDMEAAAKAAETAKGEAAPASTLEEPAAPPPEPSHQTASPPTEADADPFASAMAAQGGIGDDDDDSPDATVVAKVPDALLQATARAGGGKAAAAAPDPDEAHFREVFRNFVATRQKCGEPADGLTFDKFAVKLRKNRDTIKDKYGAKTVRFQVHVKGGKAALKATPVR